MILLSLLVLWLASAPVSLAASNPALRRYPYLTDVVGSYATINWGTDRSHTSGALRYGKVGSESCTAHYVPATKTAITVNSVAQYQWKAQLDLLPGAQYCYRVYLGSGPVTEIDLLGSDSSPAFWTQMPMGSTQSFTFAVFGDWGYVNSSGVNPYQANVMSLIASSGARFAVTTGDNGYPSGSQKNFGDLVQTGADTSAIFGPSFWKVPGGSIPIFPSMGNHGMSSADTYHPYLLTWPQDRAVALSAGRYAKEIYCCLNGTNSASYPSAWYAFDAGPVRFYILEAAWADSNIGTASAHKNDYDYHWAPGTPQLEWLKADLASHPSIVKFAIFHYPLYSDNPNETASPYLLGSAALEGLLKQNGVDLAFTGHAHIYERNLPSASGIPNYITGGGGATLGTLGTCTSLDAYAIKFTTTGKACGSAPVPTSADQVYHFLKIAVNGTNVTVTPVNSLGQAFDVRNYTFSADAEAVAPTVPGSLNAAAASGTQVNLTWSASTDNTGVRGYGIYRDGTLIATVDKNTLSYSDINLTSATGYTYRVDAFDGSGNHSAQSAARSVTTQATAAYTFPALTDAYVAADFPSNNYGLSGTLKADVSPHYRSYLRFHVNDISGAVTNVTLRLYATSSSSSGVQVQSVTSQNWEENSITYATAPALGPVIGSSGGFASASWVSVDVTSLVTGSGVYDLAVTTADPSVLNFNSRDASGNRPQLVVQTTAGVVPTLTPIPTSATGTSTPTPTILPSLTTTPGSGSSFTFTTAADARVAQASPTTNYGASTNLQADGDAGVKQNSFIRFTVTGVSGPIQRARLRVFCTTNGTANGPAAYLAGSSWTESGTGGITWNTQPALLSGVLANTGAFGTNSWVEYDVTAALTGNGTYTFALVADSNDGVTFSSREGSAPAQLVVETGSGATATSTATASATASPTTNPATATPTPTSTRTATAMPSLTSTNTPAPTATTSQTLVPANTATPTSTPLFTGTPTPTASAVFTATFTPTGSMVSTDTPSPSATPTATQTATQTPTNMPAATSTASLTSTASTGTVTFLPVADSYVSPDAPDTNYGTATTLRVDGSPVVRSYLRFTVQGISGTVTRATLHIFANSASKSGVAAQSVSNNTWTESTITYNNAPPVGTSLGSSGAVSTGAWFSIDITPYITGNGTYNLALSTPGSTAISLASRQSGANTPQLIVETTP
jgi:hypothetical protein